MNKNKQNHFVLDKFFNKARELNLTPAEKKAGWSYIKKRIVSTRSPFVIPQKTGIPQKAILAHNHRRHIRKTGI